MQTSQTANPLQENAIKQNEIELNTISMSDEKALVKAVKVALKSMLEDDDGDDENVDLDTVPSPLADFIIWFFGVCKCCGVGEYIAKRYRRGALLKFFEGYDLGPEEIDTLINMVTLVNALILTIPPGIITDYSFDTWDGMRTLIASCGYNDSEDVFMANVYNPLNTCFWGSLYCGALGLFLAIIYFFFRPTKTADFRKWWRNGGMITSLIICFLTALSACFTVVTIMLILVWFASPSNHVCNLVRQAAIDHTIAPMSVKDMTIISTGVATWTVTIIIVIYLTV